VRLERSHGEVLGIEWLTTMVAPSAAARSVSGEAVRVHGGGAIEVGL